MKLPRMPFIRAFFGPDTSPGRHQFRVGTHRADDSRPKHRGKGTAKSKSHVPKHSREAKGYDRDPDDDRPGYIGHRRKGHRTEPDLPGVGRRRAKRGVAKGKRLTPADDR